MEVLIFRPACRTHQQRGTIGAKTDFAVFVHLREEGLLSCAGKAELREDALEERVAIGKRSGMEESGGSVVENGSFDVPLRSKPVLQKWGAQNGETFIARVTQRLPSLRCPKKCSIHLEMLTTRLRSRGVNQYEDGLFREKVQESCSLDYNRNK